MVGIRIRQTPLFNGGKLTLKTASAQSARLIAVATLNNSRLRSMSRPKTHLDSWEWDKAHKGKVIAKMQKIETLKALLETWEARDDADHDYILELRAKLRSAQNQLQSMSL